MKQWTASFDFTPVAKGRPRFSKKGWAYTPKKTRDAEAEFKALLIAADPPKFEGAIALSLTFFMRRPKSAPEREFPTVRPDAENLSKLICDSCNDILYLDDSQICHLSITKTYSDKERVIISVMSLA